jgi:tRNA nucleotidyltransferase/poly(A) polymerase
VIKNGGYDFEIAQFRRDGKYTDGRRPDNVEICQDFKSDASRRDFCFNAMAIDKEGNVIDHFDGTKDIKNKVVRTVGNPSDRFVEDKLRMMRAVRFSSKLDFEIEPETKKAIKKHKEEIKDISPERVKDELFKMASQSGDKFAKAILMLDEVGILDIIMPELSKLKDFPHSVTHHPEGNPWEHTIEALKKNKIMNPIVNMAILLHDIGKTTTYQRLEGKHTYYRHAKAGKEIVDNIAKRLKLSNKEKQAIMFSVLNHMKVKDAPKMKTSTILKMVSNEHWEVLKAVVYADSASRRHLFDKKRHEEAIELCEKIRKKWGEETTKKVVKIVDGNKVMELTGLKPGPKVGEIIKKVTEWALDNNVKNQKQIDKKIIELKVKNKLGING